MSADGREEIRRRSLRPRRRSPSRPPHEIEFGFPTPTSPTFKFLDHWGDFDDYWGISSQLSIPASQDDPEGLSPASDDPLDEDFVNDADRANVEIWRQSIRGPGSSGKQQGSLSNIPSAPDGSSSKPPRRSQRLAISANQCPSNKDPPDPWTPRQSLRIAPNKSKTAAPGRPDLTAVKKASRRANFNSKPTRGSKRGQQGLKNSLVTRRDFHKNLSRQTARKEGGQIHTPQTQEVEAASPGSKQGAPASENGALKPAHVFSGVMLQSVDPPASGAKLESWEVAPGRLRAGSQPDSEHIAFSTTALTGAQETQIGPNLGFHILVLKPGTSHRWPASPHQVRLCSLAAGKISATMAGQSFAVGPRGLLKIGGGVECTVQNNLYSDAVLHVCAIAEK